MHIHRKWKTKNEQAIHLLVCVCVLDNYELIVRTIQPEPGKR